MFKNLKIGKFIGIPIEMNITLLLSPLIFWSLESTITTNLLFIGSIYLMVLLHEFGHAFVAKRWYGYPVKKIILHVLGGGAMIDPEYLEKDPLRHLIIALAGPMVNFILMILGMFGAIYFIPEVMPQTLDMADGLFGFFTIFALLNFILAVFNLIPIYPLDGGRVMKSILQLAGRKKGEVQVTDDVAKKRIKKTTAIVSAIGGLVLMIIGAMMFDYLMVGFGLLFLVLSIFSVKDANEGKLD